MFYSFRPAEKTKVELIVVLMDNNKYYLIKFSIDFAWLELFKKAPELQSINGHNLSAPSLPAISGGKKGCVNLMHIFYQNMLTDIHQVIYLIRNVRKPVREFSLLNAGINGSNMIFLAANLVTN